MQLPVMAESVYSMSKYCLQAWQWPWSQWWRAMVLDPDRRGNDPGRGPDRRWCVRSGVQDRRPRKNGVDSAEWRRMQLGHLTRRATVARQTHLLRSLVLLSMSWCLIPSFVLKLGPTLLCMSSLGHALHSPVLWLWACYLEDSSSVLESDLLYCSCPKCTYPRPPRWIGTRFDSWRASVGYVDESDLDIFFFFLVL